MGIRRRIETFILGRLTLAQRLAYLNGKLRLLGRGVSYVLVEGKPLIAVTDGKGRLVFCRVERAGLYRFGLYRRISRLERSYLLGELDGRLDGGAFIDCGANIGELGGFARRNGLDYHAFEPEELEASSCDENNYAGEARTSRSPLWREVTTLSFFSKPASADSSLIEMNDFVGTRQVTTTTLDTYILDRGIDRIAVMKIEAEGAEPEILEGAVAALAITDYVTVDCGFERGKEQESTLAPVANFLLRHGFELLSWNREWSRFLFRRTT